MSANETSTKWKYGIWGAVAGGVALAAGGFLWGGWVTASSAQATVKMRTSTAFAEGRAPLCVRKFNAQPNVEELLAELQKQSPAAQATFVEKTGAATLLGAPKANKALAIACAKRILKKAGPADA